VLAALDATLPHVHERIRERPVRSEEHRAALMLSALTIHNLPEGLAVGVAFAAGGPELGIPVAVAIGLQNIPEGFAAGAPMIAGSSVGAAVAFAAATGSGTARSPLSCGRQISARFCRWRCPCGKDGTWSSTR
jgi:ZIP family zinc transporter